MPGPNSQGPGPQNLTANSLKSATTVVSVSSATAPTSGQVLTATSGTAATWQDAAGGGVEAGSPFTTGQYVVVSGANEIESDGVKRYVALLSQSGTDAPVATVLENTLGGTVVWTRDDEGIYHGTLAAAFTSNKTWVVISNGGNPSLLTASPNDTNIMQVRASSDGTMNAASIEIRVFP